MAWKEANPPVWREPWNLGETQLRLARKVVRVESIVRQRPNGGSSFATYRSSDNYPSGGHPNCHKQIGAGSPQSPPRSPGLPTTWSVEEEPSRANRNGPPTGPEGPLVSQIETTRGMLADVIGGRYPSRTKRGSSTRPLDAELDLAKATVLRVLTQPVSR